MLTNKIRIYELAKELKQEPKSIIKDLQLEGANISSPSDKVNREIADKIRSKYFPQSKYSKTHSISPVKVIKKVFINSIAVNSKLSLETFPKYQECPFCKTTIKFSKYDKHIKIRCPKLSQQVSKKYILASNKLINNNLKIDSEAIEEKTKLKKNKNLKKVKIEKKQILKERQISNLLDEKFSLKQRRERLKKAFKSNYINSSIIKINEEIKNIEKKLSELWEVNTYKSSKINLNQLKNEIKENSDSKFNFNSKNLPKINETNRELIVERVYWTLLPEGEWLFSELTNHFRCLNATKKWRNKSFDENRLQKIEKSLQPNKCFIGIDEFEGYIVYCFDGQIK